MNKTAEVVNEVNNLGKTVKGWENGIKEAKTATIKATKSLDKGVKASKKMALEMTTAVGQVASTGEQIFKEIELIISHLAKSIQDISNAVNSGVKEGHTEVISIGKELEGMTKNPVGMFRDFMGNGLNTYKEKVTRVVKVPTKVVKGTAKKITDAVKRISSAFTSTLGKAKNGVAPFQASVEQVAGSFEPNGKIMKESFEDSYKAALKIKKTLFEFTVIPAVPKLLGPAFNNAVWEDMQPKVLEIILEVEKIGTEMRRAVAKITENVKKGKLVTIQIE